MLSGTKNKASSKKNREQKTPEIEKNNILI